MICQIKTLVTRIKNYDKHLNIQKNVKIVPSCKFGGYNRINDNTTFFGSIDYASYIGMNCFVGAKIGKFTCIANNVTTSSGKHPTKDWATVHPAFFSTINQCGFTYVDERKFDENTEMIEIGNDCWIGTGALILGGVKIGDGAIVAAGSVVTNDIEPYSVVGGVPAKKIKDRFDAEDIEFLKSLKWWDKDDEWRKKYSPYFCDVKKLRKVLDNNE